jgi:hypothetical protein
MKLEFFSPAFNLNVSTVGYKSLLNIDIRTLEPDFRQNEYRLTFYCLYSVKCSYKSKFFINPVRNTINDGIFFPSVVICVVDFAAKS